MKFIANIQILTYLNKITQLKIITVCDCPIKIFKSHALKLHTIDTVSISDL